MGKAYKVPTDILNQRIDKILEGLALIDKKNERASSLSGGMKRRLNLAMSMIHNPDILFLDEVFLGLDPQSRLYLYDFLRKYVSENNKTAVITSHLMEVVDALSDRVCIMDHGQILVNDKPEELKKKHGKGDVLEITVRISQITTS